MNNADIYISDSIVPNPKVTVCVVTYNQINFVRQCLESLVTQVTNFEFEIVVADDCSTDGTVEVLQDLRSQYPEKIRLYCHRKNIGANENFRFVHQQARGEYVAHMDGDDYALPGKLQVQAEYLDANKDCQIVWHQMKILNTSSGELYDQYYKVEFLRSRVFGVDDLILSITLGVHSSKMYRKWSGFSSSGLPDYDFSENVMHLHHVGGYAAFLPAGPLGVYRSGIGISRNRGRVRSDIYRWLDYFYSNGVGSQKAIAAKVLLMTLSDWKHNSSSFSVGRILALKILPKLSFSMVCRCRNASRLPITLARQS